MLRYPLIFNLKMKNNKKGFTLLEIVISSIILAITSVGLAGICISGKKYIAHARARMAGGELGELFLNP
ncbi:MAG: prepilin-type N-terminal cleavage/methylation domain-containing protein, partial [Candidatus Omnitrophota bacterium]